jgi:peptidylprolyl isomerase
VKSRPAAAAVLVLSAALALSACGSSGSSGTSGSASASSSASASYVEGTAGVTVTGDLGKKPTVKLGADTKNTTQLTVKDLVEGTGDPVKPGATVTAQYLGIGANTGKEFDSSWSRGQAAQFSLAQVIQGWQDGIPGMKMGGRRLLVIPAAQAYGANPPAGSSIQKDEVLVFVVDLVPTPTPTAGPHVTGNAGVTVSGDGTKAPTITVSKETAGTKELTIQDIAVGTSTEASTASTVTVQYVGVGGITGKTFDSTFTSGQPATFPLAQVISGFRDGIAGMKVGGRRLIVIPADQAYGANPPSGTTIQKNEPLVFVVDLVSVS